MTSVTAPFFLQSIDDGAAVTFSYLKAEVDEGEHSCALNLFLAVLNSSLNRFVDLWEPLLSGNNNMFMDADVCEVIVSNRELIHEHGPNDVDEDIQNYVLHLEDEIELGFGGVLSFDSDEVQPLPLVEPPNSWSLPLLTLTCLANTLPNICKVTVDSLFNSVNEGLRYTLDHLEESLNNVGEAKTVQKTTRILWHEVELTHTWLGNTLQRSYFIEKRPTEILKWFSDKAEEMVVEINKNNDEEMFDNSKEKLIAANSMYRITQTIMLKCHHIDHINCEQLFAQLSDMIVSIMVACLTNLPRVIAMKCHGSKIEEREASVRAAAKILGSAKKIIERLQTCELPSLELDQMAFIDKWRVYLKQSIP
ncbi:hypothetical protein L1987_72703 [Smallanthus sonchifolius]|uniref:Uncharacterized protein n=1 Tax=Smallanthus sonchifolius TaxID=185202 RepID=A0ACB9AWN8_9ASTR|nr:hypothetical protein L1987_72703 [Smallanthus sonchifolius]